MAKRRKDLPSPFAYNLTSDWKDMNSNNDFQKFHR